MRIYFCWATACLLVVAGVNAARSAVASDEPTPRVTLGAGVLEGTHFGSDKNDVAFLGVPYAAPPVGELRWKPPQPVQQWDGVRQATQYGPACPQPPAGYLPTISWNENCLYLNVWTTQVSANAKMPVIVYFHGGSNTVGYSQFTPLGPALAPRGVVVVTANYRLGPLGFLALPALTEESKHHSSGNYGLLDQLQALQWVRENISRLGGDPARVTVMGQSSGAVDICLLMASPLATGMFQGAILESGDCQSVLNEDIREPIAYNSISGTGEGVGARFSKDLGVADGHDALQRLRRIPADELLKVWNRDPQVHFDAIVDGWVIPEQPAKIFAEGKQLRIPVLVGSNADEATVFPDGGNPKTIGEYKDYLRGDTGKYSDDEFRLYPAESDAAVPAQFLRLEDDSFAYGAYSLAESVTRSGQKAYLYYFTFAETGKRAHLGAYHGEELKFLSDTFPADWEHSRDDEELGKAVRGYWIQFAKTGDPNGEGLAPWLAFNEKANEWMELGRAIRAGVVPERLRALEDIENQIFTSRANAEPQSKSH
jgi:para-nitrobenzyl esterase